MSESIVIVGGGLIGVCTAYYMTKQGLKPIIVEANKIAGAASGNAGGFMARTWCDEGPTKDLAHHGWHLHARMAKDLQGASTYQYRKLQTIAITTEQKQEDSKSGMEHDVEIPEWIDGSVDIVEARHLGGFVATAQIHPEQYVNCVWAAAQAAGAQLQVGTVMGIEYNGESVSGVKLQDGTVLPATTVVLALGPWMSMAEQWLPQGVKLPTFWTQKYHTLTFRPQSPASGEPSPHGVYVSHTEPDATSMTFEMYSRRDGTYVVVGGKAVTEIEEPGTERPVSAIVDALTETAGILSETVASCELQSASGTYIPLSADNVPVVGKLTGAGQVFLGGGVGCFGVVFAPAIGELLTELVQGAEPSMKNAAAYGTERFAV